eukprot:1016756-Rhodomonas_salina.1
MASLASARRMLTCRGAVGSGGGAAAGGARGERGAAQGRPRGRGRAAARRGGRRHAPRAAVHAVAFRTPQALSYSLLALYFALKGRKPLKGRKADSVPVQVLAEELEGLKASLAEVPPSYCRIHNLVVPRNFVVLHNLALVPTNSSYPTNSSFCAIWLSYFTVSTIPSVVLRNLARTLASTISSVVLRSTRKSTVPSYFPVLRERVRGRSGEGAGGEREGE